MVHKGRDALTGSGVYVRRPAEGVAEKPKALERGWETSTFIKKNLTPKKTNRYNLNMKKWKEKFRELLLDGSMSGGGAVEAQAIKISNIPNRLFKYCDFSKTHDKENLANNKVWLSNVDNFNDPYDSSLTYSYEAILNQKIKGNGLEFLFKGIDLRKFSLSKEEETEILNAPNIIRKMIEVMGTKDTELTESKKEQMPGIFKKAIEEYPRPFIEASRSNAFISCFSEINTSIIMWSHYACKHKGFCIEYNIKEDISSVHFYPVFYEKKLFDLTKYLLVKKEEFNNFALLIACLTKSKEWEYEKEWRLIPFYVVDKGTEWHMPKPTALYVGAKANPDDEQWLKGFAQDNRIHFYKEKIDEKEFKIYF